MATFITTVLTPVITLGGLYGVKYTIDVQLESRVADMYIKQADFIHDDLRNIITFFKQNRLDNHAWQTKPWEFSTLLAVNLKELIGLVRRFRLERFDIKNKRAVSMRIGSISDDIQKFLLQYGIIVKSGRSVEVRQVHQIDILTLRFVAIWALEVQRFSVTNLAALNDR